MRQVFDCGDWNTEGVCHAICGRWIYICKKKGAEVTDLAELGSKSYLKLIWDAADDADHIDKNNLLLLTGKEETAENRSFSPDWMATKLTMSPGPAIMVAWDNSLAKRGGKISKELEGHSMATMKIGRKLQFLDPNTFCVEFDNYLEFFDFLPGYIRAGTGGPDWFGGYPELTRYKGVVRKYK